MPSKEVLLLATRYQALLAGFLLLQPAGKASAGRVVDIATNEQDLTVHGALASDFAGYATAVGDLNGDGIGDLVVTAPDRAAPGPLSSAGAAFVTFGPFAAGTVRDLADTERG